MSGGFFFKATRIVLSALVFNAAAGVINSAAAAPDAAASRCLSPDQAEQNAVRLLETLRTDLRAINDQIRATPFLQKLSRGDVSVQVLQAFAGEQYHITRSDFRSEALMINRFGGTAPNAAFFRSLLTDEVRALKPLMDFAAAVGMTEDQLKAYEPKAGAQAYTHFVSWLSLYGSDADIAAALLMNYPVFAHNAGQMAVALERHYEIPSTATAFFRALSPLPPDFEKNALGVIARALERCAAPNTIKRSARLIQAYEKSFWETMAGL